MKNPYEVLGVPQKASEEQIKQAYRELAKKYHPDRYVDSPLKDVAQEKMQEINEAYDVLIRRKNTGGYAGAGGYQSTQQGSWSQGGNAQDTGFSYIRQMIASGNIAAAEQLLDQMGQRPAEWYFLRGSCYLRRGWYAQAKQHLEQAVRMDPGNPEYNAVLNNLNNGSQQYTQRTYRSPASDATMCNCCTNLLCADCCCECMGGDLIPCC